MRRYPLLILPILLLAILAVACSAESQEATPISVAPVEPILDEWSVVQLASTFIVHTESFICDQQLTKITDQKLKLGDDQFKADFKESGIWVAHIGGCTFVVDDATGKVTGP